MNPDLDQFDWAQCQGTAGTPSEIFDLLRATLVNILAAPVTAALLRRSAERLMGKYPELEELAITRKSFEYSYTVPAAWRRANEQSTGALEALEQDLSSLLLALTGPVVVHRLRALPQLAKWACTGQREVQEMKFFIRRRVGPVQSDPVQFTGILVEIAWLLESVESSDERVRHVLKLLGRLVPYDFCAFLAGVSKEAGLFTIPEVGAMRRATLQSSLSGVLRAIERNGDVAPRRPGSNCLVLPVIGADRIAGAIQVERDKGYDLHHVQLLSAVASQLGAYLERVELAGRERRAQEALREREAILQFSLQAAQIGDWDLDLPTGKARCSFIHDQCFGAIKPLSDWSYEKFLTYLHPDDREEVDRKFIQAVTQQKDWSFECRVIWADGSTHWIQMFGSLYGRVEEKPDRMLGIIIDVTARKRAEDTLRKADSLTAASRMASTIAHEINNPLEAVMNLWFLLRTESLPATAQRRLEMLGAELKRVNHITKQTLNFYRQDKMAEPADLIEAVNEVVALIDQSARCKGVKIEVRYNVNGDRPCGPR